MKSLSNPPKDPEDKIPRDIANSDRPKKKSPEDQTIEDIDKRSEVPGDKQEEENVNTDPNVDDEDRDKDIKSPAGQGLPYS